MLLVGVLAFPWAVHALVVGVSALGMRPLGSTGAALAVLASAGVFSVLAGWRVGVGADEGPGAPLTGAPRWLAEGVFVASVLSLSVSFLAAVALPVIAYDALAYRLPAIASWLDAGRVAWLITDDAVRNGYPLGQEAVSAVVAAALGSLRFAAATSFLYVIGGALAVRLFAARQGVRPALARAAAGLFLLVPMVLLNAPSGYVDAAFAGAAVSFVLLAALAVRSGDRGLAVAAGMAAAHTLSLKGNGIAVVGSTLAALVAVALVRRSREGHTPGREGVAALAWGAAFALPGAFWALRNVVHTHNPLWPVEVRVAGRPLLPGLASMESVLDVAHNTPPSLASLSEPVRVARTWLELSGPAHAFDDRLAGLGLAWPLLALPAIVWLLVALRRSPVDGAVKRGFAVVLVATGICFALQPMRWWPRYTVWLWGLGAVAIAFAGERLIALGRPRLLAAGLALAAVLGIGEAAVALSHANGLSAALTRIGRGEARLGDVRDAPNAAAWVEPAFWATEAARAPDVCRGSWKPGTDDANLDGVLAQLTPRPRVHVVPDDDGDWEQVRAAWREAGCTDLLLLQGSPALPFARNDPEVTVETAVAFDPLFVVRPRRLARLDARNVMK